MKRVVEILKSLWRAGVAKRRRPEASDASPSRPSAKELRALADFHDVDPEWIEKRMDSDSERRKECGE